MYIKTLRVFGLTTVKNEAHSYLESCLAHTENLVDDIFVYDDQSTDNSVSIAQRYATPTKRKVVMG